jgi:enoyl-[acyl-carrier protein] reductase I
LLWSEEQEELVMPSELAQRGLERTPQKKPEWKTNEAWAVGKGATVQEFVATVGDRLEIDVAPWGEGHFRVNGVEFAYVNDAKDRRQAFRKLSQIGERYAQAQAARFEGKRSHSMIPAVKAKLLEGKKGLIVGIANDNSIAYGVVPRRFGRSARNSR